VPLRFAGSKLEINAARQQKGKIRVELLDAGGRVLDGFGISEPFTGDSLNRAIVFPGNPALATLGDRPVSLRFHLRDAELYAFAFRVGLP